MIDLVAELRQLSSDLVSVSPQSAAIKGKHPQILDAAAHRIAALTAENARLREALHLWRKGDVPGHPFGTLAEARTLTAALLAQPEGAK